MTHSEKVMAMREDFISLGINPSTGTPFFWRVLWRLGFKIPPPLFMSFRSVAWTVGGFCAVFWGLFMLLPFPWAPANLDWRVRLIILVPFATAFGAFFGLRTAKYCRSVAQKYGLPSWGEYHGHSGRERT